MSGADSTGVQERLAKGSTPRRLETHCWRFGRLGARRRKSRTGRKHRHGRGRKDTQCRRAVADGDVLLGSICTLGDHAPDEFHGVKTGGTSRSRMSPPGAGSRCASLGEARRGEARSARWYSVEIWVQFLLSDAISSVSVVVVVSTGEAERLRPGRDHPMPACPCPRPPSKTRV